MNRIMIAAAAGCALTAAVLTSAGLANATTPSGLPSVSQTVMSLQGRGYTVIVNGSGGTALDQCTSYSLRPGHTFSRMDTGFPGAGDDIETHVVSMTVYLDAHC